MDQNWTNKNGIFQLSVASMGPLATISYHLKGLTRSHPQGGVQIYHKGKFTIQNQEKKSNASPAPISIKFTYIIKKIIQSIFIWTFFW